MEYIFYMKLLKKIVTLSSVIAIPYAAMRRGDRGAAAYWLLAHWAQYNWDFGEASDEYVLYQA